MTIARTAGVIAVETGKGTATVIAIEIGETGKTEREIAVMMRTMIGGGGKRRNTVRGHTMVRTLMILKTSETGKEERSTRDGRRSDGRSATRTLTVSGGGTNAAREPKKATYRRTGKSDRVDRSSRSYRMYSDPVGYGRYILCVSSRCYSRRCIVCCRQRSDQLGYLACSIPRRSACCSPITPRSAPTTATSRASVHPSCAMSHWKRLSASSLCCLDLCSDSCPACVKGSLASRIGCSALLVSAEASGEVLSSAEGNRRFQAACM
mmetsp:Transcript_8032/g.29686  ORF Transcript_8032/g.29686 Transcript_8032/m.29686 type:complete len:265 (-) Transcript_8032:2163-2957(-)